MEAIDRDKQLLIDLLAEITSRTKTRNAATSITYKKLNAVTKGSNEMKLIAEDALSESYMLLSENIIAGEFKLGDDISLSKRENAIAKYLLMTVSNYCNKRLRNWSLFNENGKLGTRARVVLSVEEHMQSEGLDIVRSKYVNTDKSDNDIPFNMNELLSELDLTDDERWIINLKSTICEVAKKNGKAKAITFAQIAKKHGQSEDKYRKQHKKALNNIKQQVALSSKFSVYVFEK